MLGLVAGGLVIYRHASRDATVRAGPQASGGLSDGTRTVLQGLDSTVEIRFYSLLDQDSVPASIRDYAARVDQLLSEYQRESNGKIKVTQYRARSDSALQAASADRIKPFNLDKGDACYLGLTVACKDQKESLPQLSPEWEPALESDLTRAIVRVMAAKPPATAAAGSPQPDLAVTEEVRRALPDLASVSVEEGTRRLQEKALALFATTVQETEPKLKEAQQRFSEAQKKSPDAAQLALKELQQVQAEQTGKLKEIAARLQAQIAALEQLKKK